GVGSYGRGRFGMCRFLRTQGTRGLVRQARKRCGVGGALAARRDGLGWLWLGRHVWAGPGEVQHDKQPQESQDHELIVKLMWNHGKKPPHNGMVGGHCTRFSVRDNYPQRRGTRPLRPAPIYAMPHLRPPSVCLSLPMARWQASGSASASMAAACAPGARTAAVKLPRDATALRPPGASHACW